MSYIYYLLTVALSAGLASYFTFEGLKLPKYVNSKKPSWYPPSYLFGIMWTIIYLLYSYSWYLSSNYGSLQSIFIVNMILNILWCYLFFSLGLWDSALISLIALDFVLLTQVIQFYKYDTLGSMLLIPYLGWSCFATFLNYTMITLN